MRKKLSIVLVLVLLASAVPMAITPAAAISEVYEEKILCDTDENGELTKEELVSAILPYMLDEGAFALDDVGDAAYVYAYWNGEPKTVIDYKDRSVTFYRPLERIVTARADGTRLAIALGACDKLVGTGETSCKTSICPACGRSGSGPITSPEECKIGKKCARNVCGGRLFALPQACTRSPPLPELLIAMKPDVVFGNHATEAYAVHERTHIPYVCFKSDVILGSCMAGNSFEEMYESIEFMASLLGKENEAEELISFIEEELDKVREVTSQIPDDEKKTVWWACRGFTRTVNYYDPLEVAGGINVAKDILDKPGSTLVNIQKEQIIKWNPDVIIIACGVPSESKNLGIVLEDPIYYNITAVKTESVYYGISPYSRGSPQDRNLINAIYMAKILYPEKFEHLDIEEEGNRIFEAFLGVDGLFTEYADYTVWMREFLDEQQKS